MAVLSKEARNNLVDQYVSNIPVEMRERKQWLCYRNYAKQDDKGNWKHSKIPYSPALHTSKGWNNAEAWVSFEDAIKEFQNNEVLSGLSFMVTNDDPYVAIDLDHCIENGQLSETATEFVSQLNGTYIERSRSKTGLHIFCKANLVEGNFNNNGVEMYRENKPIAMTGDSRCKYFQSSIEIKERAISNLYKKYAPKRATYTQDISSNSYASDDIPSDDEIVELMSKYDKNGYELYMHGGGSGDASKDDWQMMLHLNKFLHGDVNRMTSMFMYSACARNHDATKRPSVIAYENYVRMTANNASKVATNYWNYSYGKKKPEVHFNENVSSKEIDDYFANKSYHPAAYPVPSERRAIYLMNVYDKKAWDLLTHAFPEAQKKDDWSVINSLTKFCSGDEKMVSEILKKSKYYQKFDDEKKQKAYDYYIAKTVENAVNSPKAYFWKYTKSKINSNEKELEK